MDEEKQEPVVDETTSMKRMYDEYLKSKRTMKKGMLSLCLVVALVFFFVGVNVSSQVGSFFLLPNNTLSDEYVKKFYTVYQNMIDSWYFGDEIDLTGYDNLQDYLTSKAIQAITTHEIDPFTGYHRSEDQVEINTCGIGVSMERYDGYVYVNTVYEDSGANQAGIQVGDLITLVDGNAIQNKTNQEIQSMVRGDCGKDVVLTVVREAVEQEYTVHRTAYLSNSAFVQKSDENTLMVRLVDFSASTKSGGADRELKQIFDQQIDQLGVLAKNFVLDLRGNGGGDLQVTVNIADMLLPGNQIITTLKRNEIVSDDEVYRSTTSATKYDFEEIYILIDGNSASASEVLTLALYENMEDKVHIIGATSYGKGSAQKVLRVDGDEFRLTFAKWYSPKGNNIHGIGITPTNPVVSEYTAVYEDLYYNAFVTYELGAYNLAVLNAKKILNEAYDTGLEETGYFDVMFQNAILTFQQQEGLNQSGKLDPTTSNRLLTKIMSARWQEEELQLISVYQLMK